ncbi:MAG: beta-ketoacyl-[Bacteroidales bacterium]|nr:beta-ketoacyl-[acyl-carrier-protein] synthase family protein [Bacteroidales bacterium]
DAFHQTASSPDGEGAFLAMKEALEMAGLSPQDVGYVNAHGTGTPNNDLSESHALRRIFGPQLPPFSSTKPFTGHTTSASGSIEAVFCLLAMRNGFIPANLNWSQPIEEGLVPVTATRKAGLEHVLCNAFGFGGNDSSLLFSKPEGR